MSRPFYVVRPQELPFQQRLLSGWWGSKDGQRFATGFLLSEGRLPAERRLFRADMTPDFLVRSEAQRVRTATPYWISEEMMALAQHAEASLPDLTVREEHLPSPSGFMYFAAPRISLDARDKHVAERIIVWHSTFGRDDRGLSGKAGVSLSWYTGRDDEEDDDYFEIRQAEAEHRRLPPYLLLHAAFWPYGTGWKTLVKLADGTEIDVNEHPEYDWRRCIMSLWQLMKQTIVRTTSLRASRREVKQATRARQPVQDVRIITLRRAEPPRDEDLGGDHVPRNWTHRWVVQGHWRRLHQMTKDGREVTWVNAYVKGPEGLPLRFHEDVYKLVR